MSEPGGATHLASGKVREIYALDDERLLLVASDRISTFDVILPTPIPDKGRVLTGMSAFWFARTSAIVPNHLLELGDDGRSTVCRRLEMLPVEFVVRGYLSGSSWVDYQASGVGVRPRPAAGARRVGPPARADRDAGDEGRGGARPQHHRGRGGGAVRGRGVRGGARRRRSALYAFASAHAEARGIVLADTKFEFGVDPDGVVTLGDEALTPDSSRFWPGDSYAPGGPQPSFDKQYVRDYCLSTGWDRTDPGPEVPDDVVLGTRARYIDAFERLTEISFAAYLSDPKVVL